MLPQTQAASLLDIAAAGKQTGSGASQALTSSLNLNSTIPSSVADSFTYKTTDQLINEATAFNTPGGNPLMSNVDSIPKILAAPSFVAGAKDTLAAVDVYGVNKTTPINSITALPSQSNLKAAESLKGSKSVFTTLNGIIDKAAKNAGEAQKANPLVRITQANDLVAKSLRSLPPGCSNNLLSKILSSINKNSKVSATVGGLSRKLKNSQLACITGMGDLLNKINGTSSSFNLSDPAASIASLSGVVKASAGLGIPGTFKTVVGNITDKLTVNQVAADSLSDVTKWSDLGSLKDMSLMTSPGSLLMTNPNLVNDFSGLYKRPDGAGVTNDVADYQSILASYDAAHPGWKTAQRATDGGTENITDISSIMGSSSDFKSVMKNGIFVTGDQANSNILLAETFPKTSVSDSLATQFPGTSLSIVSPLPSKKPVDPITLAAWQEQIL